MWSHHFMLKHAHFWGRSNHLIWESHFKTLRPFRVKRRKCIMISHIISWKLNCLGATSIRHYTKKKLQSQWNTIQVHYKLNAELYLIDCLVYSGQKNSGSTKNSSASLFDYVDIAGGGFKRIRTSSCEIGFGLWCRCGCLGLQPHISAFGG